ncbi:hypothetical protein K438DRAFT_2049466 [Mycena galopus ATCC 62051]|nr:hypothetical protein K438DRAFT_2049466 [Mycena galopus ATCC 62051]
MTGSTQWVFVWHVGTYGTRTGPLSDTGPNRIRKTVADLVPSTRLVLVYPWPALVECYVPLGSPRLLRMSTLSSSESDPATASALLRPTTMAARDPYLKDLLLAPTMFKILPSTKRCTGRTRDENFDAARQCPPWPTMLSTATLFAVTQQAVKALFEGGTYLKSGLGTNCLHEELYDGTVELSRERYIKTYQMILDSVNGLSSDSDTARSYEKQLRDWAATRGRVRLRCTWVQHCAESVENIDQIFSPRSRWSGQSLERAAAGGGQQRAAASSAPRRTMHQAPRAHLASARKRYQVEFHRQSGRTLAPPDANTWGQPNLTLGTAGDTLGASQIFQPHFQLPTAVLACVSHQQ